MSLGMVFCLGIAGQFATAPQLNEKALEAEMKKFEGRWETVASDLNGDKAAADGPDQGQVYTAIFECRGDDDARMCGPAQIGGPPANPVRGRTGQQAVLVGYKRVKP